MDKLHCDTPFLMVRNLSDYRFSVVLFLQIYKRNLAGITSVMAALLFNLLLHGRLLCKHGFLCIPHLFHQLFHFVRRCNPANRNSQYLFHTLKDTVNKKLDASLDFADKAVVYLNFLFLCAILHFDRIMDYYFFNQRV